MLEADDVLVMEGAVNLDLRHELGLGAALGERTLHDDLGCLGLLVFEVSHFVTLGETALAEELAIQVLLDDVVAVELDNALFDDGLRVLLGWHATLACVGLGCHYLTACTSFIKLLILSGLHTSFK